MATPNKETIGYYFDSLSTNKVPVTDPLHVFTGVSGATDSASPSTLTYTTATAHGFMIGQSVTIFGFSNSGYNFSSNLVVKVGGTVGDVTTTLGAGRPAVIIATTTTTFKVKATGQVTGTATGGYVINDTNVSNSPWDSTWLPTSGTATNAANYQVGLEWGDSFPIQPTDGRAVNVGGSVSYTAGTTASGATTLAISGGSTAGITLGSYVTGTGIQLGTTVLSITSGSSVVISKPTTAAVTGNSITFSGASISGVSANGATVTYTTNNNHNLSAGQWVTIDGIVPAQFNNNLVQVASASGTTFVVVGGATGTFDAVNSYGQVALVKALGGAYQTVLSSSASVTAGPSAVAVTAAVGDGTKFSYTVPSTHNIAVGQTVTVSGLVPTAYNITGVVSSTGASTIEIANTTANPGTITKTGWASTQTNVYKTQLAHNLIAGQNASVTDAVNASGVSLPEFNVSGQVISTASSTTLFSLNAKKMLVDSASPVTISGTAVTYILQGGHNVVAGTDSVSAYGFLGGANLNTITDAAVVATTPNSITVNTPAPQSFTASGAFSVASNQLTITKTGAFSTFKPGQIVTISGVAGVTNAAAFNTSFVIISATADALVVAMPSGVTTTGISGTAAVAVTATTASVPIAGATPSGDLTTSGQTLVVPIPNNFVVGQNVTVANSGATAYNTAATVTAASANSVTLTYPASVTLSGTPTVSTSAAPITVAREALPVAAAGVSADSSKFGYLVEKGTSWASGSTGYVNNADDQWGQYYAIPSVQLNPNADNSEIATTARLGYPDFFPTFVVPNVVGKTYTNAIQALKAAGLEGTLATQTIPTGILGTTVAATTAVTVSATTNVKIGMPVSGLGIASGTTVAAIPDSTHITLSTPATGANTSAALSFGIAPNTLAISAFATTASTVTYTVPSVASLSVGDYVNIVYVKDDTNTTFLPNTQYNRNQVAVASIDTANNKFTIKQVGVNGANPTGGVVIPLNTVVTAQDQSAGTVLTEGTDSKTIVLTRNSGL